MAAERLKKQKKEKPAPIKKVRVYQALTDAINRDALQRMPAFAPTFLLFEPEPGSKLILRAAENREVALVSDETVVNEIVRYIRDKLGDVEDFQLTHREAKEAMAYWRSYSSTIQRPQAIGWANEDEYTFRRLPWSHGLGEHPTWDKLLGRMSNALAFCHWIGSLFYPQSSLHQYAWVHGEGGDGKGAINRFLARVFGMAYCSKQPPSPFDKFWTYGLLGKRLVVFPDCNSQAFVVSGLFKSLTGGDPVDVEAKGRMSFTFHPACKYLFFSNVKPSVTAEKSDKRRIIYCEFNKREENAIDEPEFEDLLWQEGGSFLSSCLQDYISEYPRHGQMRVDNERLDEWIEIQEEKFEGIFAEKFSISFDQSDRDRWVSGPDFTATVTATLKATREVEAFRCWVERRKGIRREPVRYGPKVSKKYVGLVKNFGV